LKIKLHIGTEKTASSYLQSLAALGRESLDKSGMVFPRGWIHDERSMTSGQISAGNGRRLAQALSENDPNELERQVSILMPAHSGNAEQTVIISSEWLLPALVAKGRLSRLQEILKAHGATSVSFLLVLRDPVDQCLSLYKHRAKRGTAGDIATWCASGYHVPAHLASFRTQAEALGTEVTVQPYSRAPGKLESHFFEDWLGVPVPQVRVPKTVNPSLTMSELTLIEQVAQMRPALVEPLYDALVALDPKEKVQGAALEAYARAVATQAVAQHAPEWAAWNRYLPANAQLTIPEPVDQLPSPPAEVGFSDAQIAVLADLLGRSVTPGFLAQMAWRQHLRPTLGRARRAVWRPAR
jgi:hypothetical protein